jgi:hypothetical protein
LRVEHRIDAHAETGQELRGGVLAAPEYPMLRMAAPASTSTVIVSSSGLTIQYSEMPASA